MILAGFVGLTHTASGSLTNMERTPSESSSRPGRIGAEPGGDLEETEARRKFLGLRAAAGSPSP